MDRPGAYFARPGNEAGGEGNEDPGDAADAPFQRNLRMAAAFAAARQAGNEGLRPGRRADRGNQGGGRAREPGGGGMLAADGYRLAQNNDGARSGGPNNVSDASSDFRSNDTSITSESRSNGCASGSETRSNEDDDTSPSPSEQDSGEQESAKGRHSSLYYSGPKGNEPSNRRNRFKNDNEDTIDRHSMSKEEADEGFESESTQVRTNDSEEALRNSNSGNGNRRNKYAAHQQHSRSTKKRKASKSSVGVSDDQPTQRQDQASKMHSSSNKKFRKRHKSAAASKKGHEGGRGFLGDEIESKKRSYDDDGELSELSSSDGQSCKASPEGGDDADTTQATTSKSKSTKRTQDASAKAGSSKRKQSRKPSAKDPSLTPKPKRPMSAYNFFFREERAKILNTQGSEVLLGKAARTGHKRSHGSEVDAKMSFENMGRMIASRWKSIDPVSLERYTRKAEEDGARYRREMSEYYEKENERRRAILFPGMEQDAYAAMAGNLTATPGLASSATSKLQSSVNENTRTFNNSSGESASTSKKGSQEDSFISGLTSSVNGNSTQSSEIKMPEDSTFGWNNGMPVPGLSAKSNEGSSSIKPVPQTESAFSQMQPQSYQTSGQVQPQVQGQVQTQQQSQIPQLQVLNLLSSVLALQGQNRLQTEQGSHLSQPQGSGMSLQTTVPGQNLNPRGSLSAAPVQNANLGANPPTNGCTPNGQGDHSFGSMGNHNAQIGSTPLMYSSAPAPTQGSAPNNNVGNLQLTPQILQQLLLACQQPQSSNNSGASLAALLLANVLVQGQQAQQPVLPQQQQQQHQGQVLQMQMQHGQQQQQQQPTNQGGNLLSQLLKPQQQRITHSGNVFENSLNSQAQVTNQTSLNNLGSNVGQDTQRNINVARVQQERRPSQNVTEFRNTIASTVTLPQSTPNLNPLINNSKPNSLQGQQPRMMPQPQQQQDGSNLSNLLLPLAFMLQQQQQPQNGNQLQKK